MYKINELSKISGVSTRTLRYYDSINLLKPEKIDSNGYRLYSQKQVDILQQILFYREFDMPLCDIKKIIQNPAYDKEKSLNDHLSMLKLKEKRIATLIKNIEATIISEKEGREMSNEKKFEGFKEKIIYDNEKKFGKEIRERYGDNAIDSSNEKLKNMSETRFNSSKELSNLINEKLLIAFNEGDPSSDLAQEVCDLHRQWLCIFWKDRTYTKEAHKALANSYVVDERFTAYYDSIVKGATKFLRDAINIYCSK